MRKISYILTAGLLMTGAAQAANINWSGGGATDDWNDTANWGGAVLGTNTADQAVFNGAGDSNTPTTDFAFAEASNLTTRNEAHITIGTGVNISGFGAWRLGANNANGGGHITMTGGSLDGVSLQVASSPTASSRSSFTVSGGSLTTSGTLSLGSLADFNLTGNAASFDVASFTAGNGSIFNATYSSGMSTIDAGSVNINAEGALLNVDLGTYTGTGDFDLITFDSLTSGYASGNVVFSGLDGGRTATLESDADSLYVHVIPEPATLGLVVALGSGLIVVRRFFRI
ncbi:PEP-CTERM sorting domain-containing protein [Pontiellaceae bacterium B12219]|nr:PEP-CTERM sorting domain-containing protein [Pontiellaceae bacterium B12219]